MQNIINAVSKEKLIAIVRGVAKDKLIPLAEAMYQGGIRLLEVTYSANGKISDEETAANIKMLCDHFGDRMYIGAGTVIRVNQVKLTKEAGGKFIISPDTNVEIIKLSKELGLVSMPGAFTPTEIQTAHNAGADFVKLVPAVNCGPDYFKAVSAPLSHVKLLAVGGIDCDNMSDYLKAGVCGFGIGSNIIDKKLIDADDYEGLKKLAEKYVEAVNDGF